MVQAYGSRYLEMMLRFILHNSSASRHSSSTANLTILSLPVSFVRAKLPHPCTSVRTMAAHTIAIFGHAFAHLRPLGVSFQSFYLVQWCELRIISATKAIIGLKRLTSARSSNNPLSSFLHWAWYSTLKLLIPLTC